MIDTVGSCRFDTGGQMVGCYSATLAVEYKARLTAAGDTSASNCADNTQWWDSQPLCLRQTRRLEESYCSTQLFQL